MNQRRPVPSTQAYRAAVKAIVSAVQRHHDLNDVELADRLGCSASTVRNAKSEHTNLDAVTLANMEHRFGPGTLDPFLALGGSRAAPLPSALPEIDPVLDIVTALHRLIAAQHASSEHGYFITSQELLAILHELRDARIAFDTLIALAEPTMAHAPPETQKWFRDTFAPVSGTPSLHDGAAAPKTDAGDRPPPGFEDAALELTIDRLAAHYGVSSQQIEQWIRVTDEQIAASLARDARSG